MSKNHPTKHDELLSCTEKLPRSVFPLFLSIVCLLREHLYRIQQFELALCHKATRVKHARIIQAENDDNNRGNPSL